MNKEELKSIYKAACERSHTNSPDEGSVPCPYCGSYSTRRASYEPEQELWYAYHDAWKCDDCDNEFELIYKMEFDRLGC